MEKLSFTSSGVTPAQAADHFIERPAPGTSSVTTIEPGAYTQFLFKANEINATSLTADGGLELKLTNGATLVITNFKELAGSAQTCGRETILQFIKDTVDEAGAPLTKIVNMTPDALLRVMDPMAAADGVTTLVKPDAGLITEVTVTPGAAYRLAFDLDGVTRTIDGNNLIFSFKDGSLIVLHNFVQVAAGELPPQMTLADGVVISLSDLGVAACTPTGAPMVPSDSATQVAKIAPASGQPKIPQGTKETLVEKQGLEDVLSPQKEQKESGARDLALANMAEQVAAIEPAAGGAAAGASGARGGFGFSSGIDPAALIGLHPLGPLMPSAGLFSLAGIPLLSPSGMSASAAPVLPVIPPVPTSPTLLVQNAQVFEDGAATLVISTTAPAGISTTIIVQGIPPTWTVTPGAGVYDPLAGTWTISLPAGQSFTGGPTIAPPVDSDGDILVLDVSATATDTTTGGSSILTDQINVVTDAVADIPTLSVSGVGVEDAGAPITITTATTDTDGSEIISGIRVFGVPTGFSLNNGALQPDGSYALSLADLSGLVLTAPTNYSGTIVLQVQSDATETIITDQEITLVNNTASAILNVPVTFAAVADAPDLVVSNICIHEDGSLTLPIIASLSDRDGSEFLTITVQNVPALWTVDAGSGTYDPVARVWTITMPAGQDFSGGPIFFPNTNSDIDSGSLTVTATSTEQSNGLSAGVMATVTAFVDAVADTPNLNVTGAVAVRQGMTVPLSIAGALNDLDGSETLSFRVSGLPIGAVLSAGIVQTDGSWVLSSVDLSNLVMTPAPGFTGTAALVVDAIAAETNLSGVDCDPSNNTAIASAIINVTVAANSIPVLINAAQVIDETASGPLTLNGSLNPDFGVDSGVVATNGSFTSSGSMIGGSLSSGGVPVTVTSAGNVYTGMAGGATIFTLTIAVDGTYTYNQLAELDHADANNPNDVISLIFGAVATDTDGEQGTGMITINVLDDAPDAVNDVAAGAGGAAITGNIMANDIQSRDAANNIVLITFGAQTLSVPASGMVTINGAYGTLQVDRLGAFTYTPVSGATGVDNFGYVLRDFDGDTDNAILTISVADGIPVIGDATQSVDETTLGPTVVTGTLAYNFGTDGPGTITPQGLGTFASGGSRVGGILSSGGDPITVTLTGDTYIGQTSTQTIFTLQVATDGTYTFTLFDNLDHADANNPNDVITLNFGVLIQDAGGDTDTGTITINVLDDAPIANPDQVTTPTGTGVTGNVLLNDVSTEDPVVTQICCNNVACQVLPTGTTTIQGTFGSLTIASDGAYTYTPSGQPAYQLLSCFNPEAAQVALAGQPTLTQNGMSVTAINPTTGGVLSDLTWVQDSFWWGEKGIGIAGGATNYAEGQNEGFRIALDTPSDRVTITVGGFDLFDQAAVNLAARVYTENGGGVPQIVTLTNGMYGQFIGIVSYQLSASDFGDSKITQVDVYANDASATRTWTLLNVGSEEFVTGGTDTFTYVARDADGDTSSSTLVIEQVDPITMAITSFVAQSAANTNITSTNVTGASLLPGALLSGTDPDDMTTQQAA